MWRGEAAKGWQQALTDRRSEDGEQVLQGQHGITPRHVQDDRGGAEVGSAQVLQPPNG